MYGINTTYPLSPGPKVQVPEKLCDTDCENSNPTLAETIPSGSLTDTSVLKDVVSVTSSPIVAWHDSVGLQVTVSEMM